jgi:hypothetical protein
MMFTFCEHPVITSSHKITGEEGIKSDDAVARVHHTCLHSTYLAGS